MDVKFDYGLLNDMLGATLEENYKILTELCWIDITQSDRDKFLTKIYPMLRKETFEFLRNINDENKYLAKKMFYQFYEFKNKIKEREVHASIKVLFVKWLEAERDNNLSELEEPPVKDPICKEQTRNNLFSEDIKSASNYIYLPPVWLSHTITVELWEIPQNVKKSFREKQDETVQTAESVLKLPEMYIGLEYLSVAKTCITYNEVQSSFKKSNIVDPHKQWIKTLSKMNNTLKAIQIQLEKLTKMEKFFASEMKATIGECITIAQDVDTEINNTFKSCQGLEHAYSFIENIEQSPHSDDEQNENVVTIEEVIQDSVEILSLSTSLNSSKLAITFRNNLQKNEETVNQNKKIDNDLCFLKNSTTDNCYELFDKAHAKLTTVHSYWSKMLSFLRKLKDIVPDGDIKLNEPLHDMEHAVLLFRIKKAFLFAFMIDQAIRMQIKTTEKHILPLIRNSKSSFMEAKKRAVLNCKAINTTVQGIKCVFDQLAQNIFNGQNSIKAC